ncbi:MAG TPA: hypothetical protein ENI23_01250 [bacterium]|nr:hypothetical protein [bacterium]
MKRRTECYICNPVALDLCCPVNEHHPITWSEYEKHIWCYVCKKDIKYDSIGAGPIPIGVSKLLGIDYRKYNIKTGKIRKR